MAIILTRAQRSQHSPVVRNVAETITWVSTKKPPARYFQLCASIWLSTVWCQKRLRMSKTSRFFRVDNFCQSQILSSGVDCHWCFRLNTNPLWTGSSRRFSGNLGHWSPTDCVLPRNRGSAHWLPLTVVQSFIRNAVDCQRIMDGSHQRVPTSSVRYGVVSKQVTSWEIGNIVRHCAISANVGQHWPAVAMTAPSNQWDIAT